MSGERERATVFAGLGLLGCAGFVLLAIAAEVVGSQYANSPVPVWSDGAFPLAWPQPARVVWWVAVAGAAVGYRVILHRTGIRQRMWVVAISVLPFVAFVGGIAAGADWATWH